MIFLNHYNQNKIKICLKEVFNLISVTVENKQNQVTQWPSDGYCKKKRIANNCDIDNPYRDILSR